VGERECADTDMDNFEEKRRILNEVEKVNLRKKKIELKRRQLTMANFEPGPFGFI
jgi:hypothetical protein